MGEYFSSLLGNCVFVDLQYGDTSAERKDFLNQTGIEILKLTEIDNFNDLDGLAALIQACDTVLTVSNTTIHLAGALGKESILLVPYGQGQIWYWHDGEERSSWYPSVQILRQLAPEQWVDVVEQASTLLANS